MNEKTRTGLEILQAAVLLGILGDVLLRQTPWGLNVFLLAGALVAAFAMLALRRQPQIFGAQAVALNAALLFFAAMFAWRDSIEMKTLDALAILTILAVLTLPALRIKPQLAGIFHYAAGFVWAGISAFLSPFLLLIGDIEWKTVPQTGWTKHLLAAARGLLIAAPLVLIFGALFVAADAVFQGIVEQTLNIQADVLVGHVLFTTFFAWVAAGYLRGSVIGFSAAEKKEFFDGEMKPQAPSVTEISDEDMAEAEKPLSDHQPKSRSWRNFDNSLLPRLFTLGAIEISIVLGLINLLFLSFVLVQLPYLFGGMELVRNTPDFKLAEYARRGFGELVAVAALVLPILLASHWLLRNDAPANEKIYRVLAAMQIILLFVIMLSAAQRLILLTGDLGYGLTTVRFYPFVFMIWLAAVFVWFAATVLRAARERFAWGALWSALFVLASLHFVNPDDYIVRTNLQLMREGRPFDAVYNSSLSADAVPRLLENLPAMKFEDRCAVKRNLLETFHPNEAVDVRTWNWSRETARETLAENAAKLNELTNCPVQADGFYTTDQFR